MADGPTTAILDAFTRADENPLSGGGNWAKLDTSFPGNLRLVSNALLNAAAVGMSYWTPSTLGDFEAYATFVTLGTAAKWGVGGRLFPVGTSGQWCGYFLTLRTDTLQLQIVRGVNGQVPNSTTTQLASKMLPAFSAGDKIFLRGSGNFFEGWVSISGSWRRELVVTDNASLTMGAIGIFDGSASVGASLDDFGGGAYAGPPLQPAVGAVEPRVGR